MSKTQQLFTQLQFSMFDALHEIERKNQKVEFCKKLAKRTYQLTFIQLTKELVNDNITVDEYKAALHELCEAYRKDWHNEKKKTI